MHKKDSSRPEVFIIRQQAIICAFVISLRLKCRHICVAINIYVLGNLAIN